MHKKGRDATTTTDLMTKTPAGAGARRTTQLRRAQRTQGSTRHLTSQRPTRSQAEQGKRLAVKAAGDIGTSKNGVESGGDTSDHTVSGTESEAAIYGQDLLEGVTPRTADDL